MSTTRPAPLATGLQWRFVRYSLLGSTASVVAGSVLFLFGLDLTTRQMHIGATLIGAPALALLLGVVVWLSWRQIRPLARALRDLHERGSVSLEEGREALIRALNLPILAALRIMAVQIPVFGGLITVCFALANAHAEAGFGRQQLLIAWMAVLFVGTGHAIVEYFLVAGFVRPALRDLDAGGVVPDEAVRLRIIPISMRRKFFAVAVFAVLTPLVILGFTVLMKVNRLVAGLGVEEVNRLTAPLAEWIVLLIGGGTAVALYMSFGMGSDVLRSTNALLSGMRRIGRNDLETSLSPTTTDEFAVLYEGFNHMVDGLRQRERLRDAFGRFVAPQLAEIVAKSGVSLGGATVHASVLFADIRGFTAMAEQLPPTEVVELLNAYFGAVEPPIEAEGGWINKFGGDSLLAVFGAPIAASEHARQAVRAARGMRAALAAFNETQAASGGPTLRIGIGIDSGEMVAGVVGSRARMEYTVIGDSVNAAARIHALTKSLGTDCLLGEAAVKGCQEAGEPLDLEPMPPQRVQGKAEPIRVYALRPG